MVGNTGKQLGDAHYLQQDYDVGGQWVCTTKASSTLLKCSDFSQIAKAPHKRHNVFYMPSCPKFDVSGTRFVIDDNFVYDTATALPITELERPISVGNDYDLSANGFSHSGRTIWGVPRPNKLIFSLGGPFDKSVHLILWNSKGQVVTEKVVENCRKLSLSQTSLNTWRAKDILLERQGEILVLDSDSLEIGHQFNIPFLTVACIPFIDGVVVADEKGCVRVLHKGNGQANHFNPKYPRVIALGCSRDADVVVVRSLPEGNNHSFETEAFHVNRDGNLLDSLLKKFPGLVTGAWPDPTGERLLVAYGAWNTSEQFLALYSVASKKLLWSAKFCEKPITSAIMFSKERFAVSLSKRVVLFEPFSENNCVTEDGIAGLGEFIFQQRDISSQTYGKQALPHIDIVFHERFKKLFFS